MRNILVFGGLIALSIISACKENDNEQPINNGLVGEWHLDNISVIGCNGEGNGETSFECSANYCEKIEFNNNNTFEYSILSAGSAVTDKGTYRVMNDGFIEICKTNGTVCNSYTLTFFSGSWYFSLIDTDGATGCITTSTYTNL